jgi:hypothetical protein
MRLIELSEKTDARSLAEAALVYNDIDVLKTAKANTHVYHEE